VCLYEAKKVSNEIIIYLNRLALVLSPWGKLLPYNERISEIFLKCHKNVELFDTKRILLAHKLVFVAKYGKTHSCRNPVHYNMST